MDRGLEGFDPVVLSKAKRLAVVLDELVQDDAISGRLALHGGTAINTFLLDMPRLSVDIDLSVISDAAPEQVPALREEVIDHIARDLKGLGYHTNYGKGQHAGRTIRFSDGDETLKADVNFLNRTLPFKPRPLPSKIIPDVSFPIVSAYDAYAGKLRALLSRERVRDLFDISSIAAVTRGEDDPLFHGTLLLYATLSDYFPQHFGDTFASDLDERFGSADQGQMADLRLSVRRGIDVPALPELIEIAKDFIIRMVDPRDHEDMLFVSLMRRGDFQPDLILPSEQAERARKFPAALWKVRNLARYAELPRDDGAKDTLTLLAERKEEEAGMRTAGGDQGAYGRGDR